MREAREKLNWVAVESWFIRLWPFLPSGSMCAGESRVQPRIVSTAKGLCKSLKATLWFRWFKIMMFCRTHFNQQEAAYLKGLYQMITMVHAFYSPLKESTHVPILPGHLSPLCLCWRLLTWDQVHLPHRLHYFPSLCGQPGTFNQLFLH